MQLRMVLETLLLVQAQTFCRRELGACFSSLGWSSSCCTPASSVRAGCRYSPNNGGSKKSFERRRLWDERMGKFVQGGNAVSSRDSVSAAKEFLHLVIVSVHLVRVLRVVSAATGFGVLTAPSCSFPERSAAE